METYEAAINEAAKIYAEGNVIGASAEALIRLDEELCLMRDQIAEKFDRGRQMVYYDIEKAAEAL